MTHDVPETEADLRHGLACDMVDALVAGGALRSERWVRAFRAVPRDAFVPRIFVDPQQVGRYEPLDGTRPGRRRERLELVYADEPLVVQLDGVTWLSSSSQPSLMARMLEALAVTGTERVIEIGTGTGYNTALLCEGLGSGQVTSVDIDADLIGAARARLREQGYQPVVAVADGAQGYTDGAPYDRIMATCSMQSVPAAWIRQCAPRALIMVNLYRELGGGALALLTVDGDEASGRFLPFRGGFMPTRTYPHPSAVDLLDADRDEPGRRTPVTVPAVMLDDDGFGMLAALRLPGVQRLGLVLEDGSEQTWLLGSDKSWARQGATDMEAATQGGPVRLWDRLDQIHHDWIAMGRPARQEFGLTVTAGGSHRLWYESPSGPGWSLGKFLG